MTVLKNIIFHISIILIFGLTACGGGGGGNPADNNPPVENLTGMVTTFSGALQGADGTGNAVSFNGPDGLTRHLSKVYIADAANHVIRSMDLITGEVVTIAGKAGAIGNVDAIGDAARFNHPSRITTDGTYLYLTDWSHTIRVIEINTGIVSTLAGSAYTMGAVDGIGDIALFRGPKGITTDGTNLYVVDQSSHTIRKIVISTAEVTTIAGLAGTSGSVDGVGSLAQFYAPTGITIDSAKQNLYITDNYNHTIRKLILATNEVITLAGTAGLYAHTDAIGAAARFINPVGIVADDNNLYVTDSTQTVRQIVIATAEVSTLAGTAYTPGSADGIGAAARFSNLWGITHDGVNLYVVSNRNNTIRKIVIASAEVTTFAGSSPPGDGIANTVRFNNPHGITSDGVNLYVADTFNNTIRQIDLTTGLVTTIAGKFTFTGSTDGAGTSARFNYPKGIATDGSNVYVADTQNHTIRKIDLLTGGVSTLAGSAGLTGSTDAAGVLARFNSPSAMAVINNDLYVVDTQNHIIRKIVIASGEVTTVAGTVGVSGSANGIGISALFNTPQGITTDGTNLFIADFGSQTIRQIDLLTSEVTTLAGTAGVFGSLDGIGTSASFVKPRGISSDGTNLYVADEFAYLIRKIVIATGEVSTIAGTGVVGSADGVGNAASFNRPCAITVNADGIFVADTYNMVVRHIVN